MGGRMDLRWGVQGGLGVLVLTFIGRHSIW